MTTMTTAYTEARRNNLLVLLSITRPFTFPGAHIYTQNDHQLNHDTQNHKTQNSLRTLNSIGRSRSKKEKQNNLIHTPSKDPLPDNMAAYLPQHAARDANRYPGHLVRQPRKLSVLAVTAATPYSPTITSPSSDNLLLPANQTQKKASKTLKKGRSFEFFSSYSPKHGSSDSSINSSSSKVDLDHPLLRKVGILPRGTSSPVSILPASPEYSDDNGSEFEHFLEETYHVTSIAQKPNVKVINIERNGKSDLGLNVMAANQIKSSSPMSPTSTTTPSASSSRRSSSTSNIMSKVADYIKPSRPDSMHRESSHGSASGDGGSAQGSRKGSVFSGISRLNLSPKRKSSSAKDIDVAAIEKAVIDSYRQPRTAPSSPEQNYHRTPLRA